MQKWKSKRQTIIWRYRNANHYSEVFLFFFLKHLVKLRDRGDETGFSNKRSLWCLRRYLLLWSFSFSKLELSKATVNVQDSCGNSNAKTLSKKKSIRKWLSIVHEVVNLENAIAYISIRGHQYLADGGFSPKVINRNIKGAKLKKKLLMSSLWNN